MTMLNTMITVISKIIIMTIAINMQTPSNNIKSQCQLLIIHQLMIQKNILRLKSKKKSYKDKLHLKNLILINKLRHYKIKILQSNKLQRKMINRKIKKRKDKI